MRKRNDGKEKDSVGEQRERMSITEFMGNRVIRIKRKKK